ncbi:CRAL/TRIO domain-containing protein [Crepidotus variabilis]|uniref:CRAL/TRIO domain-containing protein n=1 Tax=Crepidotus variabilis TaxID=179855 RepID=A0A9P6EPX4_9AGAR|nr:CRAL/TRIO domain-containing protein [Crepidotus variabilis]
MGTAGNRNHEEILKPFREQLYNEDLLHDGDSIGTDDETLLRFLRARKFDITQAKKMFTECQNWRKTVAGIGIDELYKEIDPFDYPEREAVFECWPMWFHKKGRPLNIHFFGNMNLNKLYKSCTPERHWKTVIVNCESLTREILPAASRCAGRDIGSTFVIVDLKGFGLGAFWQMKSLAKGAFQISQDYYPETMGQLAIINAPSTFTTIWAVIKQWLAKETTEKVDILGSDYKDVLLSLIDAENLPTSLGGNCSCAEDGGCHLSGAGPWRDGRVGWGPKAEEKHRANKLAESTLGATTGDNQTPGSENSSADESFASAVSVEKQKKKKTISDNILSLFVNIIAFNALGSNFYPCSIALPMLAARQCVHGDKGASDDES